MTRSERTRPGFPPLWRLVRDVLRRHWLIATLIGLAAVIRILVMIAYVPAFWFDGDSGAYIDIAERLYVHRDRPLGYPVVLAAFRPTGTFVTVVAFQHLAGLAMAAGIYALLRRRGLGTVGASLAAVPVLFDAMQISLEHYILTETVFTSLLVAAVGLLLWRDRPSPAATAVAGVLLAGAWFTRPMALAAAVLLAAYLVLRRVGWRRILAFACAFGVPFAAVLLLTNAHPNVYKSGGIFLYGRTAFFADCDKLVLSAEQREFCPPEPIDDRPARADHYIWVSPPRGLADPSKDHVLRSFAVAVITQQPGDYLRVVARETAAYFFPWADLGPEHGELAAWWTLPATVTESRGPWLASAGFDQDPADLRSAPAATTLTEVLHWYGTHVRTPLLFKTVVVAGAVLTLVLAWRRRRSTGEAPWPNARDAGFLAFAGVALLAAQVGAAMYELRYSLPTLPFFCVAAGLAWAALRRAEGSGADTPDHAPAGRHRQLGAVEH